MGTGAPVSEPPDTEAERGTGLHPSPLGADWPPWVGAEAPQHPSLLRTPGPGRAGCEPRPVLRGCVLGVPGSSVAALAQREDTGGVCLGSPLLPGTVLSTADQDFTVQEPWRQGEWWLLGAPGPPAACMAAPSVCRGSETGQSWGPQRDISGGQGRLLLPETALPVVTWGRACPCPPRTGAVRPRNLGGWDGRCRGLPGGRGVEGGGLPGSDCVLPSPDHVLPSPGPL